MTAVSAAVEAKAARYLAEGRLTVLERSGATVRATCVGGGAGGQGTTTYELGHDADGGFWCCCPAHGPCAHLHALRLVVATPPGADA